MRRKVKRFRETSYLKAHILVYHSTLGWSNTEEEEGAIDYWSHLLLEPLGLGITLSHTECFKSRFEKVNFPTNLSTYHLLSPV